MTIIFLLVTLQDPLKTEDGKAPVHKVLESKKDVYSMAASPDGKTLALGTSDEVLLVGFEDGKLIRRIEPKSGAVRGLCFSPDGAFLAAAVIGGVFLFDAPSGKLLLNAKGHPSPMSGGEGAYSIGYCGEWLLTVSRDESNLRSWSLKDGSAGASVDLKIKDPSHVACAGDTVAVMGRDGELVALGRDLKELWRKSGLGMGAGVGLSPDGKRIAAGGSMGDVPVWGAAKGEELGRLPHYGDRCMGGIAWTSDGSRLVTAAIRQGGVRVWSATEFDKPPVDLDAGFQAGPDVDRSVVLGAGGKLAAVASGSTVKIYRLPE
jgi:WD40 repeat protein